MAKKIRTPERALIFFQESEECEKARILCKQMPALASLFERAIVPSLERHWRRYWQHKAELDDLITLHHKDYQDILYTLDSVIQLSVIPKRHLSFHVDPTRYIVNVSGGLTSFEALKRAIEKHGKEHVHGIFADTLGESKDTYRFIEDQERYFAIEIDILCDGRTVWEVFEDRRCIKLPRMNNMAPCSQELKRWLIESAVRMEYGAGSYVHVAGLDWSEMHRVDEFKAAHNNAECWFPLLERPYVDKCHIGDFLESVGIQVPALYQQGFSHNNCNAECVKGGQAHWALKLETDPDGYRRSERKELQFIQFLGRKRTILRDSRGGQAKPMTLQEFRERIEAGDTDYDRDDWGGCGCFAPIAQLRMDDLLLETDVAGMETAS